MDLPESIAIIDSDPDWIQNLRKIVSNIGISNISEYLTQESAIEGYQSSLPDLVLLDADASHLNGLEILKKIRGVIDPKANIIVISKSSDRNTVIDCIENGALHYILKGEDFKEIENKIIQVIKKTRFDITRATRAFERTQVSSFI